MEDTIWMTGELERVFMIDPCWLDYMVRSGVVGDPTMVGIGRGNRRIFPAEEVKKILFVWRLRRYRMEITGLKAFLKDVEEGKLIDR
jgi:hypothetical protein